MARPITSCVGNCAGDRWATPPRAGIGIGGRRSGTIDRGIAQGRIRDGNHAAQRVCDLPDQVRNLAVGGQGCTCTLFWRSRYRADPPCHLRSRLQPGWRARRRRPVLISATRRNCPSGMEPYSVACNTPPTSRQQLTRQVCAPPFTPIGSRLDADTDCPGNVEAKTAVRIRQERLDAQHRGGLADLDQVHDPVAIGVGRQDRDLMQRGHVQVRGHRLENSLMPFEAL